MTGLAAAAILAAGAGRGSGRGAARCGLPRATGRRRSPSRGGRGVWRTVSRGRGMDGRGGAVDPRCWSGRCRWGCCVSALGRCCGAVLLLGPLGVFWRLALPGLGPFDGRIGSSARRPRACGGSNGGG